MVDIAGAAAGPQLYGRPDPLVNGTQTSQVAAEGVAPDQAVGVTAPGDLDAEGDGSGGQGDFENPASGENIFQAQLAGSEEELAGSERPLSPIEEAILDFPPDAVVQPEETFSAAATEAVSRQPGVSATNAEAEAVADSEEAAAEFGVSEAQAEEQAQATRREESERRVADEDANRETPEPRSNLSGATDDPFNIANGSAASQSSGGSPSTQPPGSTVDIAA